MENETEQCRSATILPFSTRGICGGGSRPKLAREHIPSPPDVNERLLQNASIGMENPKLLLDAQIREICFALYAEYTLRKHRKCLPTFGAIARRPERHQLLRALIADDVSLNRDRGCEMLTELGFEVDPAAEGAAALAAVQNRRYDLIIMDIRMPVLDGIRATRLIRALPGPQRQVPILAFSQSASLHEIDACLAAGMDDVITEPFGPAGRHVLQGWLGRRGIRAGSGRSLADEIEG